MFGFIFGVFVTLALAAYVETKNLETTPGATSKIAAFAKKFTDMF